MAGVRSPGVLARSASACRSPVPAALKLRDSCHACATSKVKCNKEKPTCGRCIKRGLTCEYFATKRAGRKHDKQSSDPPPVTQTLPESSSFISETSIWTSPSVIQPSPWRHTPDYSDIVPNFFSSAGPASSSTLTTFNTDFDDFFASPISLPVSDTSDLEIRAQPRIDFRDDNNGLQNSNDVAALLIPKDAFSSIDEEVPKLSTLSKPRSPSNSRDFIINHTQSFRSLQSESSCCCLIHALGLLKQLFPTVSKACICSAEQGVENDTGQLPTIQSVITENEQIIKAISDMLQCSCSQDSYLLIIVSLIVFKVLSWYAAAARETSVANDNQGLSNPHSHPRLRSLRHVEHVRQCSRTMSSDWADDEDQGRMAAQRVLSELHRVQRLVNLLSQRLKSHTTRNDAVDTLYSDADGPDTLSDEENTTSFSVAMMDQLEADLRKRLRSLSLDIVDRLRRE